MLAFFGFVTLAAALFAGRAVLSAVTLHLAADRALRTRKLDLEERALVVTEQRTRNTVVPASIPPDLMRRISRWGTEDAQASERKILLDLYNEYHDQPDPWASVRNALPPEQNDELPQQIFSGLMQT